MWMRTQFDYINLDQVERIRVYKGNIRIGFREVQVSALMANQQSVDIIGPVLIDFEHEDDIVADFKKEISEMLFSFDEKPLYPIYDRLVSAYSKYNKPDRRYEL